MYISINKYLNNIIHFKLTNLAKLKMTLKLR